MNWGEMAYLDSGDSGCPLLFLHGTGCDSSDWIAVIEELSRNLRCIALDFRGHGQSTVPTQPFTLADLTTVNTDWIIVLHNGEVIEQAKHSELMKAEGLYADSFNLQSNWKDVA